MPSQPPDDPPPPSGANRDLLANERTLLAWARTSVTIIGLGFVVARFGLLIRELANAGAKQLPRAISTTFGVALVLCGALLLALAYWRYRRVAEDILHGRAHWDPRLGTFMAGLLVLASLLLAFYLLVTS